ncbi:MAG: hypothetical protein KKA73_22255 [Chloroflexi bacterium]|nr:hypothetical protein [Chloroflexota bacterium]MBU1750416.1 hypothetical protein [Chloroflexota bacterium]
MPLRNRQRVGVTDIPPAGHFWPQLGLGGAKAWQLVAVHPQALPALPPDFRVEVAPVDGPGCISFYVYPVRDNGQVRFFVSDQLVVGFADPARLN